jgi:hypothetical protein
MGFGKILDATISYHRLREIEHISAISETETAAFKDISEAFIGHFSHRTRMIAVHVEDTSQAISGGHSDGFRTDT